MNFWTFVTLSLVAALILLSFFYQAWLFIDVVQRRRSKRWLFSGLAFGLVTAPFWLWSRRRSPVTEALSRKHKLGLAALALALVVGVDLFWVAFRTWGFSVARVEGKAMSPTLQDQNRLIVNHVAYLVSGPDVGDIAMIRYPADPEKKFVERIVARGGDRIEIKDGHLYRNGDRIHEPYLAAEPGMPEDWGPQEVPAGHYFVMGDNRGNSSDSRHWGPVQSGYVLGRVGIRWWPTLERVDGLRAP
jgi:signal peptidase I